AGYCRNHEPTSPHKGTRHRRVRAKRSRVSSLIDPAANDRTIEPTANCTRPPRRQSNKTSPIATVSSARPRCHRFVSSRVAEQTSALAVKPGLRKVGASRVPCVPVLAHYWQVRPIVQFPEQ